MNTFELIDYRLDYIMIFIKRILHLIPFVHFYTHWKDRDNHGGYDRQDRYCKICNKRQNRVESPVGGWGV